MESALLPVKQAHTVYLGFSGGVDSHVLLQLCSQVPFCRHKMTAVYIDHGLQALSSDWTRHCQQVAERLAVKFLSLKVDAAAGNGQSPEEAARDARYRAFAGLMRDQDVLLLAQHQEDQMETVLLQLFRGAGLPGLAAMPERAVFAKGQVLRPLLQVDKQSILAYARQQQLVWVDDPSNQRNDFDRNYLRNDIIPRLKQRWPGLDKTVSRSAQHCADAQNYLEQAAEAGFKDSYDRQNRALGLNRLSCYDGYLQKLILRYWFKRQGLRMPSLTFIDNILHQVIAAAADADPVLLTQGHEIRRYRGKLYCLKKQPEIDPARQIQWPDLRQPIWVDGVGRLQTVAADSGFLLSEENATDITVRFRQGGEKILLPDREGRRQLKTLLQQAGIPPWQRQAIPLLYLGETLLAVGDYWIAADFYHKQNKACLRLQWQRVE